MKTLSLLSPGIDQIVAGRWSVSNAATVFEGDCRDLITAIPDQSVQVIVTSPPYNIGKSYERKVSLAAYLKREREVINLCIDKLKPGGSICWQVGNRAKASEI